MLIAHPYRKNYIPHRRYVPNEKPHKSNFNEAHQKLKWKCECFIFGSISHPAHFPEDELFQVYTKANYMNFRVKRISFFSCAHPLRERIVVFFARLRCYLFILYLYARVWVFNFARITQFCHGHGREKKFFCSVHARQQARSKNTREGSSYTPACTMARNCAHVVFVASLPTVSETDGIQTNFVCI